MALSKTLGEIRYQKKPKRNSYIPVGKIVGSFGYKGELKIVPYDSWPKEICFNNAYIYYNEGFKKLSISSIRNHNKFYLLLFKGIDINNLDLLMNKELWLNRKNANSLKKGEYYSEDLIGLTVVNQKNIELGILSNIIKMNAFHDVYVVNNDKNEYLIPALKKFINKIDIPRGEIKVNTSELYE